MALLQNQIKSIFLNIARQPALAGVPHISMFFTNTKKHNVALLQIIKIFRSTGILLISSKICCPLAMLLIT